MAVRQGKLVRLASLLALAIVLGVAAACGGGDEQSAATTAAPAATTEAATTAEAATTEEAASDLTTMAVVAPEKANDYGWNQQGVEGAQAAGDSAGLEVLVADGAGYEDITPALQQLADDGAQFIIAQASGYNTAAPEFAQQSGIPVIIYDKPGQHDPGARRRHLDLEPAGRAISRASSLHGCRRRARSGIVDLGRRHELAQAGRRLHRRRPHGQPGHQGARDPDRPGRATPMPQAASASPRASSRAAPTSSSGWATARRSGCSRRSRPRRPRRARIKVWFIDVIGDKTRSTSRVSCCRP